MRIEEEQARDYFAQIVRLVAEMHDRDVVLGPGLRLNTLVLTSKDMLKLKLSSLESAHTRCVLARAVFEVGAGVVWIVGSSCLASLCLVLCGRIAADGRGALPFVIYGRDGVGRCDTQTYMTSTCLAYAPPEIVAHCQDPAESSAGVDKRCGASA